MARSFTGSTDSVVNAALTINLGPTGGNYSFFSRVYPTTVSGSNQSVWRLASTGGGDFALYLGTSSKWAIRDGVGTFTPLGATVTANTWYSLGETVQTNSSTVDTFGFFINGSQPAGSPFSGSNSTGAQSAGVMVGNDSFNQVINGRIADFAIWNILLSNLEMLALGNGARPYTIRPQSLVMYLPLDGDFSPEPDLSGSKNNGTVTGTAKAFGPPMMQFTPRWPMGAILPFQIQTFVLMPQIVT